VGKIHLNVGLAIILMLTAAGCAGISHGIKIYPQKVYLLVDKQKNASKIITLPDLKNSYELKPWSFLSKHNFSIKIEEGQVKELSSEQDSTAALALLQKIVELAGEVAKEAAKGAATGKAVADIDYPSSLGFETGIYELDEKGVFKKVSQ
jgi:hypothetical protein